MGLTFVKVKIINPKNSKEKILEFLIDSGAFYSLVPEDILNYLEIKPSGKRNFKLADGREIELPVGNAFFEYEGNLGASPVIFGKKEGQPLIGVVTLEALGFIIDPIKKELVPAPMLLMRLKYENF